MHTNNLSAIREQLQTERTQYALKAESLSTELASIQSDLSCIEAALDELAVDRPKGTPKPVRTYARKKSEVRSPKKADVIRVMKTVLQRGGVLTTVVLKKQVEADLTSEGFNRSGLAMRFSEACKDSQFDDTAEGISLAAVATVDRSLSIGESSSSRDSEITSNSPLPAKSEASSRRVELGTIERAMGGTRVTSNPTNETSKVTEQS